MNVKEPGALTRNVGIGVAGLIALGAVSIFVRPNVTGPGQREAQAPGSAPATRQVAQTAPLPANYLDIVRAAGI